jgi:hypothetical protein
VSALVSVFREVAALFIDDGLLALSIVAVVASAAVVATLAPSMPIVAGVVLMGGCLAVLLGNVMRAPPR